VYSSVTVLMLNETEAATLSRITALSNREDLDSAAGFFIAKGAKVVVITLGERGAYCRTATSPGKLFAARAVEVVDSTGAGDTFVGAFAAFLSRPRIRTLWMGQRELPTAVAYEAVDFAILASSFAVQKAGAQDAIPWFSDLSHELHCLS
jgi:ribokinase